MEPKLPPDLIRKSNLIPRPPKGVVAKEWWTYCKYESTQQMSESLLFLARNTCTYSFRYGVGIYINLKVTLLTMIQLPSNQHFPMPPSFLITFYQILIVPSLKASAPAGLGSCWAVQNDLYCTYQVFRIYTTSLETPVKVNTMKRITRRWDAQVKTVPNLSAQVCFK